MNNTKLARFITVLGSLNGYNSTVAQTKRALDKGSSKYLEKNNNDKMIFEDILSAIKAIKQIGFSMDGIIASASDSLEKNHYQLSIAKYQKLQEIVDSFNKSVRFEKDAWLVFVDLYKLHPFKHDNRRIALIAANAALNTWANEDFLLWPFDGLDKAEFMVYLMRYCRARNITQEKQIFTHLLSLLPTDKERIAHLKEPLTEAEKNRQSISPTIRVKEEFRSNKK